MNAFGGQVSSGGDSEWTQPQTDRTKKEHSTFHSSVNSPQTGAHTQLGKDPHTFDGLIYYCNSQCVRECPHS